MRRRISGLPLPPSLWAGILNIPNRWDPDLLTLLRNATDLIVSSCSLRATTQQTVAREAQEDYRERSRPLGRN